MSSQPRRPASASPSPSCRKMKGPARRSPWSPPTTRPGAARRRGRRRRRSWSATRSGWSFQGHDSTLPVTLEHMIYHGAAVRRGLARSSGRAHLVGDMPFGSYQASADEAVRNAMRLVAEGGAEAVKLEGGAEYADVIRRIVRAGIPVMGHIGLTPQSVHKMGGYVVQGRDAEKAQRLLARRARARGGGLLRDRARVHPGRAGAGHHRRSSRIPTIGIGAGPHCDGQVLVLQRPARPGRRVQAEVREALRRAGRPITGGGRRLRRRGAAQAAFPAEEHSFHSATLRLVPDADAAGRASDGRAGAAGPRSSASDPDPGLRTGTWQARCLAERARRAAPRARADHGLPARRATSRCMREARRAPIATGGAASCSRRSS